MSLDKEQEENIISQFNSMAEGNEGYISESYGDFTKDDVYGVIYEFLRSYYGDK